MIYEIKLSDEISSQQQQQQLNVTLTRLYLEGKI